MGLIMIKIENVFKDFINENNLTKEIISDKISIWDLNDAQINSFFTFMYSPFRISENRLENATMLTNYFIDNNYFNKTLLTYLCLDPLNFNNLKNYLNFCVDKHNLTECDGIVSASNYNNNDAIELLLKYSSLKDKAIAFYNCLINKNNDFCYLILEDGVVNKFVELELQNNLDEEEKGRLNYFFNEVLNKQQNKKIKNILFEEINDDKKIKSKRKF